MSLPPVEVPQGAIRFNTDSQKLEFYAQDQWWEMVIDTPALGTSSDTGAGARGIFGGGDTPTDSEVIDYINIASTGNAIDFGNLTIATSAVQSQSVSSSTRGLVGGGRAPTAVNTIQYVTFSSTGNAVDFGGDLTRVGLQLPGLSNATRGIWAGGYTPAQPIIVDTMDYVTISSTGDAKDFGNLTTSRRGIAAFASPTRGVLAGGNNQPARQSEIQFITISTLGDAQVFGDLNGVRDFAAGVSNATRGIIHSGRTSPTLTEVYKK
jgi:hypothetical protein